MGAFEFILAFTFLAAGILATVGYAVITVTPADFKLARASFLIAGALVCAGGIMWGVLTNSPFWARVLVVGLIGAISAVATNEAIRWVNNREKIAGPPPKPETQARPETPAPTNDVSQNAENARRAALLGKLRQEYILSHDGISPAMAAGLENPPTEWANQRLQQLGETWRIPPDNRSQNESPAQASQEKEPPLPLEKALHVGPIWVGFDKVKTKHLIEIDITAHNGSGTNLRIGNILGHIELNPMDSLPQSLPSPTLSPNTTKDMPPGSEFYVILIQEFPQAAGKAAMAALNRGKSIQLNFSELKISVTETGNTNTKTFLPLWDGVTIEKKANKYLTGKLQFLYDTPEKK